VKFTKQRNLITAEDYSGRKGGEIFFSCHLKNGSAHRLRRDIDTAVIQGCRNCLFAGMAVSWIEEQKISRFHYVFPVFARQRAFSTFNEADNVIVMKVVGKFLHYAHERISFYLQFRVILYCSCLLFHFIFLFSKELDITLYQTVTIFLYDIALSYFSLLLCPCKLFTETDPEQSTPMLPAIFTGVKCINNSPNKGLG